MMETIKKIKAETFFLIFGLFFGIILLIINPPIQAPDEDSHLFKMWGMLDLSFNFKVYDGYKVVKIPESVAIIISNYENMKHNLEIHTSKKEVLSYSKLSLKKDKNVYYRHTPTAYTLVSYFPQIICLGLLKFLNVPPFFMLYILRFFCLLCYLALIYQAIKLTPCKKWLFAILGILPVNLYIAGAINTDCLVIGISFIFIAYTLKLKFSEDIKKITNKQIFIWGILFTYLCILKYLYFPLILIYFLLPKEKFSNTKKYYFSFLLIGIINAVYILCFILHTINISKLGIAQYDNPKIDKLELIKKIVLNLPQFISIVVYTTFTRIEFMFSSVASQFGWGAFFIPIQTTIFFYILILISALYDNEENYPFKLSLKEKIIILLSIFCVYSLTLFSVFVIYTTYPIIYGWQGRYGSPYMPLLIMAITGYKFLFPKKWITPIFLISVPILYLFVIETVLKRFY